MEGRNMAMRSLIRKCVVAALTITCEAASASVIFQTGFEPPVYSLGTLNGKDQWFNATVPMVQAGTLFSGVQGLEYDAGLVSAQDASFRPITYTSSGNPESVLIGHIEMMLSDAGSPSNWTPLAVEGSNFLANLVVL